MLKLFSSCVRLFWVLSVRRSDRSLCCFARYSTKYGTTRLQMYKAGRSPGFLFYKGKASSSRTVAVGRLRFVRSAATATRVCALDAAKRKRSLGLTRQVPVPRLTLQSSACLPPACHLIHQMHVNPSTRTQKVKCFQKKKKQKCKVSVSTHEPYRCCKLILDHQSAELWEAV